MSSEPAPSQVILPKRTYETERVSVSRANPNIILPITHEAYQAKSECRKQFRAWLNEQIGLYPELFPRTISDGYWLHDVLPASVKLPGVRFRRIKLKTSDGGHTVFTVRSSDVLPYMTGYTDEVEKAVFAHHKFGVPYWGLTVLFGQDDNYWYRICAHFGRYDLVGTTLKAGGELPDHLLADEKHTRFNSEKGYIACTAGADCYLGASVSLQADGEQLTEAYRVFQEEAERVDPDYRPLTVNTDGWAATRLAWTTLFGSVVILSCFLHAFLKIRDCSRKKWETLWPALNKQVWEVYHAPSKGTFRQRMADFFEWSRTHLSGSALQAVEKMVANQEAFVKAYDYLHAHRTSNMIDRLMIPLDRWLFSGRYFHGDWRSAELRVRSWALCHNFMPYCPRAKISQQVASPAHKINQKQFHHNWLQNLLVSTSCSGISP